MQVDYLNVSIHGYGGELFVNGAPILAVPAGAPLTATPTVSEWLVVGDNEVVVRIDEVAPANATLDPRSPRRLIVERCEGPLGAIVPVGEDLVRDALVYAPDAEAPAPALPHRLVHRFRLPSGPRWAWEDAPVLTLDAANVGELRLFLEALHADLREGEIDGVVSRMRVKFAELAPRYGSDPEAARAGMHRHFAELSQGGAWTVAPLRVEELELRPCCGGRLVEPRTREGLPALRGLASGGRRWRLPVFIARVGASLEIVR